MFVQRDLTGPFLDVVNDVVHSASFVDFDGDGRADLVICGGADEFLGGCLFYRSAAAGLPRLRITSVGGPDASEFETKDAYGIVLGDLDFDGDLDAVQLTSAGVIVMENVAGPATIPSFVVRTTLGAPSSFGAPMMFDIDAGA